MASQPQSFGDTFGNFFAGDDAEEPVPAALPSGGYSEAPGYAEALAGGGRSIDPSQFPGGEVAPPEQFDPATPQTAPETFEEQSQRIQSATDAAQAGQAPQAEQDFQQQATIADRAMSLAALHGISYKEAFKMAGEQVRMPSRANPLRPIAEEFAGATGEAREREGQAETYGAVAQQDRSQQLAAMADDQAMQNTMGLAVNEAKDRERAELESEKFTALEESNRAVMESAQALREAPDVDPGRLWASRDAGQKAMFIIGGLLGNLTLGITDPLFGEFSNLRRSVQDDIDAQKYNREQDFDAFGAQVGAQNASMGVYAKLLEHHGDERLADESMRLARWDAMKQNYLAEAQKLGIPIESAEIQKHLAQFDQESAAIKKNLDTLVATTSRRVGGGLRDRYSKAQQAMLRDRAKSGLKSQAGLQELAITEQGKSVRQAEKLEGEKSGRVQEAARRQSFDQKKFIATQTSAYQNELGHWADFREKYGGPEGDIPGKSSLPIGWLGEHQMTADAREARALMERGVKIRLRKESGAGIPEPEIEREAKNIVSAMSEEDIWRDIDNREREARRMVDLFERAPDSEEVESYRRSTLAKREAMTGGYVKDPTVVD